MTDETETQDLGISKLAQPDINWSRTQPMFIAPSAERMRRPWQSVAVKNTSDTTITATGRAVPQKHVVIDRHNFGHELEPGQVKQNVEMLATDIEYFIRERQSGRVNHMNQEKPKHPIQIIGANDSRLQEQITKEMKLMERKQREKAKRDGAFFDEEDAQSPPAKQPGQRKET